MNKKRVGLCLAFKGENYGALLQAYATQYVVDSYGFDTEILDYISGRKKGLRFTPWLVAVAGIRLFDTFNHSQKNDSVLTSRHEENIHARRLAAEEFRNKRLHGIRVVNGIDDLRRVGGEYDAVIVGSDQQWLPEIAFTNFKTLRFVPSEVTKISYSTSLGVSSYPRYCWSSARQFWRRIDFLSVREEEGCNVIREICGKKIKVERVVDPTYLLTRQEWEELIPSRNLLNEPYVLCYLLGPESEPRIAAREYADKHGVKLVSILSNESVGDDDLTFADIIISGASPEDFINYIRHASRVFTDSFHGIAFSVINEVQMSVFYRRRLDAKGSRNSRIDNILNMWGIQDVLEESCHLACPKIDFAEVEKRVACERLKSLVFLKHALGVSCEQSNATS